MSTPQSRAFEFGTKLNTFLAGARDKALAQHDYNESTNIPKGILQPDETVERALLHGIASGWNTLNEWDTIAAMKLAFEILEDANCHGEAALIWEKLQKELA